MSSVYRRSRSARIAATTFVVLFLVIPIALITRVPPWIVAVGLSIVGVACLLGAVFVPPRHRDSTRHAGMSLITATVILAIIHFSGLLEPLYRQDGWLLLDLNSEVRPLQVSAGGRLTYTLSTTNPGPRAALRRRFTVDGVPYDGFLMYGRLPDLEHVRFTIVDPPTVNLSSQDEPQNPGPAVCTVIYANPGLPELNPSSWNWTTAYVPGDEVVAVITSNGETHRDLDVGETLTLQYCVAVPQDHPAGTLYHVRTSLSYRDPQWATYITHDLRFPVEDTVVVVSPSN